MDTPLRAYRKDKGLKLADLAPRLGISEAQLSRIERTGRASMKTVRAITLETGVEFADLKDVSEMTAEEGGK